MQMIVAVVKPNKVEAIKAALVHLGRGEGEGEAHPDLGPTDSEAKSRTPEPMTTGKPGST